MKKIKWLLTAITGMSFLCACNSSNLSLSSPTRFNPTNHQDPVTQHTITFDAGDGHFSDGSKTKVVMVDDGQLPTAPEENPVMDPWESCTFTFKCWYPTISIAHEDTTYKAAYEPTYNTYTVRWLDKDENELEKDENVIHGTVPTFEGTIPDVPGYYFIGWKDKDTSEMDVKPVTKDTDYVATYSTTPKYLCEVTVSCTNCTVTHGSSGAPTANFHAFLAPDVFDFEFYQQPTYIIPTTVSVSIDGQDPTDVEVDPTHKIQVDGTAAKKIDITAIGTKDVDVEMDYSSQTANNDVGIEYSATGESINVDWGDGGFDTFNVGTPLTHTYVAPGDYAIKIMGNVGKVNLSSESGLLAPGNIDITRIALLNSTAFGTDENSGVNDYAFYNCKRLKTFTMPSVSLSPSCKDGNIGKSAFDTCTSLASLTLPQNIANVGENAFKNCYSLETLKVHRNNPHFTSGLIDNEGNYVECNMIASFNPESNEVNIIQGRRNIDFSKFPNNFNIANFAFSNTPFLTELTFTNNLKTVGDSAFNDCYNLVAVHRDVDAAINVYNDGLFTNCSHLSSVDFTGVVRVGQFTFQDCKALSNITFSRSLAEIDDGAFLNCANLSFIDLRIVGKPDSSDQEYAIPAISSTAFNNCTSLEEGNSILTPCGVETSTDEPPACRARKAYEAMDESISKYLFTLCDRNKAHPMIAWGKIVIKPNATEEQRKFSLNVTYADEEHMMDSDGFIFEWGDGTDDWFSSHDLNLQYEHTYPENTGSEDITYNFTINAANLDKQNDGGICLLGDLSFNKIDEQGQPVLYSEGNANITEFADPYPFNDKTGDVYFLQSFPNYAFANMASLEKVVLPKEMKQIGANAFCNDTNLASVTLPNGIENISESAFLNCAKLSNVQLPLSIKEIGSSAFENTAIENINMDANLKTVNVNAFKDCKALINVNLSTCQLYAADADSIVDFGQEHASPFAGCDILTAIVVPSSKYDKYMQNDDWQGLKDKIVEPGAVNY